jgi:hypothetical protein
VLCREVTGGDRGTTILVNAFHASDVSGDGLVPLQQGLLQSLCLCTTSRSHLLSKM